MLAYCSLFQICKIKHWEIREIIIAIFIQIIPFNFTNVLVCQFAPSALSVCPVSCGVLHNQTCSSPADLDGNGYWDEMEVKALFKKELDKMYDPNAPEDDINERYEEMERMREHVFKESDIDRDNLIRSVPYPKSWCVSSFGNLFRLVLR